MPASLALEESTTATLRDQYNSLLHSKTILSLTDQYRTTPHQRSLFLQQRKPSRKLQVDKAED